LVDKKYEDYVSQHMDAFTKDVMRLVAQPSVSAKKVGIEECAKLTEQMLREIGASTKILRLEGAAPLVYGEILTDPSDKTVLFYNHYDVQPEEPLELWKSPPFKPEVREGRIYGRGASDDKGELVSRLKMVEAYMKVGGRPPCNVKFCFEGEEEVGSVHLEQYMEKFGEMLKADAVVWEYGETDQEGRPGVALGMKGMIYLEFVVRSLGEDAHSSYAAALPSAPWRMVKMLDLLKGSDDRILIPGWYDGVETLDEEDSALLESQAFDAADFLKSHKSAGFLPGMTEAQAKKALAQRPTANIAGIWSGYQGPGSKTVLPAEIHCKMDFRLVPNQDPKDLMDKLKKYLAENGFGDVETLVESMEPGARTSAKAPFVQAAIKAGRRVWGKEPIVKVSEAGTGPLYLFTKGKAATVVMGVSASDAGLHAPNENLRIDYLQKGILWLAQTIEDYLASATTS
jgi:acetylornithine deacetylase/succinyl-diaminopimelate desuccinylase-like protein